MSMSTASYDSEHHDGAPDYGACRRPTPPVRRGDIFYADLSPVIGSERPERRRQPLQPDGYCRRHYLPDGQDPPAHAH